MIITINIVELQALNQPCACILARHNGGAPATKVAAGPVRGDADAGEQILLVGLEGVELGALGGQPRGERAAGAGEPGCGVQEGTALSAGVCLVPGALPLQRPGRVPPGVDRRQRLGPG